MALLVFWNSAPLNVILPLSASVLFALVHIFHAALTARRQSTDFVLRLYNRWYWYVAWWFGVAVLSTLLVPFVGQYKSYKMTAQSMEDSLIAGDLLLVDLSAYSTSQPVRGEVVVFLFPGDRVTPYLKRCVAIQGDTVWMDNKRLYINSTPVVEPPTVKHIDTTHAGEQIILPSPEDGRNGRDNFGPYVVPVDSYFMMGDNRDNSHDSRYFGAVPKELLLGRPVRIYFSSDWRRIGCSVE